MSNIVITLFFSLQNRPDNKGVQYQATCYNGNRYTVVVEDHRSSVKITTDGFWKVALTKVVYTSNGDHFQLIAANVLRKVDGNEYTVDFHWMYDSQWIATDDTNGITTRFVIKDYDQPRVAMPYLQTPHHVATWRVRATKVVWSGPNQRVVWVDLIEDVTSTSQPVVIASIPVRGPTVSPSTKPKLVPVSVRRRQHVEKLDETLKSLRMSVVPQRPISQKRRA